MKSVASSRPIEPSLARTRNRNVEDQPGAATCDRQLGAAHQPQIGSMPSFLNPRREQTPDIRLQALVAGDSRQEGSSALAHAQGRSKRTPDHLVRQISRDDAHRLGQFQLLRHIVLGVHELQDSLGDLADFRRVEFQVERSRTSRTS